MLQIVYLLAILTTIPADLALVDAKHDAGAVYQGQVITHTFPLVNRTATELYIHQVKTSCGCSKPQVSQTRLAPGDTSHVMLQISTLTQPVGTHTWQAKVVYSSSLDAKTKHECKLTIEAKLEPYVVCQPPQIEFSLAGGANQRALQQEIILSRADGQPLELISWESSHPSVRATRSATTENEPVLNKLMLTVSEDSPVGVQEVFFTIHLKDRLVPFIRVPVKLDKRPVLLVRYYPDEPKIEFAPGQAEGSVLIQLRHTQGEVLKLNSASCELGTVKLRYQPGANAPTVSLRVVMKRPTEQGHTLITVIVNEQQLEIPVAWNFTKE